MSIYVEVEWLRDVILGKIAFKKCPQCDMNGTEYWTRDGISIHPTQVKDILEVERGSCQNCDGLGFVELPSNDTCVN